MLSAAMASRRARHLGAAVAYYPSMAAQLLVKDQPHIPLLVHLGELDARVTPDDGAALAERWPDAEFHTYPAGHGFNCDLRDEDLERVAARVAAFQVAQGLPPDGLAGPLTDPDRHFVKGRYERPFRYGENEEPAGGGRVTELAARPLLARLAPELLAFDQPLAGEVAARRELLESIPFSCGYGVEIAMLIEVWDQVGIEGMAQVELGTKRNAHQSLAALSGMSSEVIAAMAETLDRLGREDTGRLAMVESTGPEVVMRPAFATLPGTKDGPAKGAAGFVP